MDEIERAMNKKPEDKFTMERDNARQRRPIKDTVGFERNGIVEASPYEPPNKYPQDAQDYLDGLSRCGTLSGAAKLAGVSVSRVYKWRKKIDGFYDEEDIAKYCFTDVLEEDLFKCGLGMDPRVQGMARVKALDRAIKANRPEKYNDNIDVEVDGNITWIDIIKQHSQTEKSEEEDSKK